MIISKSRFKGSKVFHFHSGYCAAWHRESGILYPDFAEIILEMIGVCCDNAKLYIKIELDTTSPDV